MMLIDSNLIIYAAKPEYSFLLTFIEENAPSASAISYVEVAGYHKLTVEDRHHFGQPWVWHRTGTSPVGAKEKLGASSASRNLQRRVLGLANTGGK